VTAYDVLGQYATRTALRVAGLVYLGLLLRLVALPLAVAALLTGRLVAVVDAAATRAMLRRLIQPPAPPRWSAANTRTRTYATV
jgi:hypothetical protein